MLRSPNMWAIMCAYFTYVYCLWIFLSWLPSYLVEFRHFTLIKVGIFASLPLWAGVVGDTVGGLATDWLLAKTGNIKFARRVGGHYRHAGLRDFHRAGGDDRERLYCGLLPDRRPCSSSNAPSVRPGRCRWISAASIPARCPA